MDMDTQNRQKTRSTTHGSLLPKIPNPILDVFFINPIFPLKDLDLRREEEPKGMAGGGANPKGNGAGLNDPSIKSRRAWSTTSPSPSQMKYTSSSRGPSLRGAGLLLAFPRNRGVPGPSPPNEERMGEVRSEIEVREWRGEGEEGAEGANATRSRRN
jgi:hypothetical protein